MDWIESKGLTQRMNYTCRLANRLPVVHRHRMVGVNLQRKYEKGRGGGGGEYKRSSYSWWKDDLYLHGLVGATAALVVCGDEVFSSMSLEANAGAKKEEGEEEEKEKCKNVKKWALGSSTYTANDPIEDRHVFTDLSGCMVGCEEGLVAAVFDGHGGWQASEFAKTRIAGSLGKVLRDFGSLRETEGYDPNINALVNTFRSLDRDLMYHIRDAFTIGFGNVASTGACALVALIENDRLYIANAGDCRAVLARTTSNDEFGTLESVALSRDHNAREELEQKMLRTLHPFEGDIVKCKRSNACYVKGKLQPTRSLGDAYLKYSEFNGHPGKRAGRYIPPPYTPPYITCEPEVTRHDLDSHDQFLLMASDGLWDYLSNDEAVEVASGILQRGLGADAACKALVDRVLTKAAKQHQLSLSALQLLPPGSQRRKRHDDITVLCIELTPHRASATRATEP